MHGSERREQIIRQIQESKAPVSGTKLASFYNVSRQVIVQDIALSLWKNGSGTGLKFQKKGWRIYGRYSERKVKSA